MGEMNINLTIADVMLLVAGLSVHKTIYYSVDTHLKVNLTPECSLNDMIKIDQTRREALTKDKLPDDEGDSGGGSDIMYADDTLEPEI